MRAATSMFLISLANDFARLASIAAFLCLVVAHLECPDICLLGCLSTVYAPAGARVHEMTTGVPTGSSASREVTSASTRMHPFEIAPERTSW